MKKRLFFASVLAVLLGVGLDPSDAPASVVFTGSGIGTNGDAIAGQVEFDLVKHKFGSANLDAVKITLTNTAASTNFRGNLITGLFFSLDGNVGNLPTTSAGFDGLAGTVREDENDNTENVDIAPAVRDGDTDGTYQLSNGPFGIANNHASYSAFEYGIATVGMGLAGFDGKAVNGDDYGIFASGSDMDHSSFSHAFPLIDTSAIFWIARPAAWTSLDQLGSSVRITYGSLPDNIVNATRESVNTHVSVNPEPASMLVWGGLLGLASVVFTVRRRRMADMTLSSQ
jgi:hypothetical protein